MRLVTWNRCRGSFAKKSTLLDEFAPDIAVLQEAARPVTETDQCLWFGDNPRSGVAVLANGPYKLRALSPLAEVPLYCIPVEVTGPTNFLLIAVWAKKPHVEAVVRAVELYRDLFRRYRVVLIGDLNPNTIWDKSHPVDSNHSALVKTLSGLGLVSSYHSYFGEAHGQEKRFTFYLHWKEHKPYHIDYCFIPEEWEAHIRRVDIGSFDEWKNRSDHRPLIVDIDEHMTA